MPRRKLTAYTIMLIAGISAGYFMFEKKLMTGSAGFMAACILAAVFSDIGSGRETGSRVRRVRIIMASFLFAGFLLFTMRFAIYESGISACSIADETVLRGKVVSATLKEDKLSLIVRSDDGDDGDKTVDGYGIVGDADAIVCSAAKTRDDRKASMFSPRKILVTLSGYSSLGLYPDDDIQSVYRLIGTHIECSGKYKELLPADNPGCFDYRLYMRGKGVYISFKAKGICITDGGKGLLISFRRWLFGIREEFISCFDEETAGFIRGVIFGDKSGIEEEIVNEFNANSTGHILAVSGLHVGFLYGLLRLLTGRRRTKGISLFIIAIIVMYGEMTQWSAATIRACIVMSISLLSIHVRRPFDMLSSVSLAALLILTLQPYQLFDSGFRMSFLAMSGIAFFTKPLSLITGETAASMLSVQLGIMPITAYTFYRINLLSLFINIPVILLSSILVPICIVMLLILAACGAVPHLGISIIDLFSYAVIRVNHILAFDGGFSLKTSGLGASLTAAFYITSFGLASDWMRIRLIRKDYKSIARTAAIMLIPVIMLSSCLFDRFSDDDIVFVAVGQGDCTHVRAGGRNILIDGGGRDGYDTGERVLMPYLLHGGTSSADIAFVTHLHMDHFKGICELSKLNMVGALGIPADYRADASVIDMYSDTCSETDSNTYSSRGSNITASAENRSDIMILDVRPDTRIDIGKDVFIYTLWPVEISDEPVAIDDPNEHNTVYMIHYKGIKIMVTGDLLEEDELKMLSYYEEKDRGKPESSLKCDILKIAHHGSKSSSNEAFLDAASPSIAVIQCGRNNIYGHPHEQTLQRLEERGIKVYRTDISGAVGIEIRSKGISVNLFH